MGRERHFKKPDYDSLTNAGLRKEEIAKISWCEDQETQIRMLRKYRYKLLDEVHEKQQLLDEILKAVQAAPNWVNLQHISVIVVQEQKRRGKFAELCGGQKHIAQTPVFLVFCADFCRPPYCHYPEVSKMLAQQGFLSQR